MTRSDPSGTCKNSQWDFTFGSLSKQPPVDGANRSVSGGKVREALFDEFQNKMIGYMGVDGTFMKRRGGWMDCKCVQPPP